MSVKPIIFSGPMIRALLEGRKTMTRRVLKPQPSGDVIHYGWEKEAGARWTDQSFDSHRLPFWAGDLLWVREAFGYGSRPHPIQGSIDGVEYRADEAYLTESDILVLHTPKTPEGFCYGDVMGGGLRPSIHMPRWASRLTLRVTDVRVQQVQEISRDDCVAEGCKGWVAHDGQDGEMPEEEFQDLWNSLNGPRGYGWDANPWVAAYTFDVIRQNVDEVPA